MNKKLMVLLAVAVLGLVFFVVSPNSDDDQGSENVLEHEVNTSSDSMLLSDALTKPVETEITDIRKASTARPAIDNAQQPQINRALEPVSNSSPTDTIESEPPLEQSDSFEKKSLADTIGDLAKAQDWGEVLLQLSDPEVATESMFSHTLMHAIVHQAPLWVFEDLLYRGAQFDYTHLFYVVENQQLEMLKTLVSLGLDIHMTAPDGRNAVYTLMDKHDYGMTIVYLLKNRVDPDVEVDGKRPIDIVLQDLIFKVEKRLAGNPRSRSLPVVNTYFDQLLEGRIELEPRHFELIEKVGQLHEPTYNLLVKDLKRYGRLQ